jgi:hypothetical protein
MPNTTTYIKGMKINLIRAKAFTWAFINFMKIHDQNGSGNMEEELDPFYNFIIKCVNENFCS